MRNENEVLIAGAGVAGMTAALALAQRNIPSVIYEKSAVLREVGAGIQLASNATSLLDRLGLLEAIAPYVAEPDYINLCHADSGKTLLHMPIKTLSQARWGAPYVTIHRADFQMALKERIDAEPLIRYCGGQSLSNLQGNAAEGFTAQSTAKQALQNGAEAAHSAAHMETVSAPYALCCDGVWSRLRAARCNEKAGFSGYIAWRATLERENLPASFAASGGLNSVSAYMSKDSHFIIYPLRKGALYNFVITTASENPGETWSLEGDKQKLLRLFGGKNAMLRELIEKTPSWTYWPIFRMPSLRFLDTDNAVYLGDTAHAVTPFAAQGAAQAIEDSCALAATLEQAQANPGAAGAALAHFDAVRRQRVKMVAKRGDFNQFVYHLSGIVACARNAVMRLRPQARFLADLDWLYGYDALAPFAPSAQISPLQARQG